MFQWQAHSTKVRCLAFSPDGARLVSGAERTSTVRLWNPTSGGKLAELRGRWGATSGVAYSPDGKLIATTTMDYRLVVWDAERRRVLSAPGASQIRYAPAFPPDSSYVAATGWERCVAWRDPATPHTETLGPYAETQWEPAERFDYRGKGYTPTKFDSLAFSPDGRWLVANGTQRAVVWDRETKEVRRVIDHARADALTVVNFSPDSERVAFSFDKHAEIHPLEGKGKPVVLTGHKMVVRAIVFTPDGRTAITAGSDGTVRFWDPETGAPMRTFDWGIGRVYSAAISTDGLLCAAGGEKGQIVVWDADT
jgi:WD40 repeat protein